MEGTVPSSIGIAVDSNRYAPSPEFGLLSMKLKKISLDRKVEMLLSSDMQSVLRNQLVWMIGFADALNDLQPI